MKTYLFMVLWTPERNLFEFRFWTKYSVAANDSTLYFLVQLFLFVITNVQGISKKIKEYLKNELCRLTEHVELKGLTKI